MKQDMLTLSGDLRAPMVLMFCTVVCPSSFFFCHIFLLVYLWHTERNDYNWHTGSDIGHSGIFRMWQDYTCYNTLLIQIVTWMERSLTGPHFTFSYTCIYLLLIFHSGISIIQAFEKCLNDIYYSHNEQTYCQAIYFKSEHFQEQWILYLLCLKKVIATEIFKTCFTHSISLPILFLISLCWMGVHTNLSKTNDA